MNILRWNVVKFSTKYYSSNVNCSALQTEMDVKVLCGQGQLYQQHFTWSTVPKYRLLFQPGIESSAKSTDTTQ